jgi:hypothetical protein
MQNGHALIMETLRMQYLLVDGESVHSFETGELGGMRLKILLFVGEHTKKVSIENFEQSLKYPERFSLVRMHGNGPNALDFHIAYHAGRISVEDTTGFIHILSKDTGFDPLIAHLKSGKVFARRYEKISDIPIFQKDPPFSLERCVGQTIEHLCKVAKARPRRRTTLTSTVAGWFLGRLTEPEIAKVIASLEKSGKIAIDAKGIVTYRLETNAAS